MNQLALHKSARLALGERISLTLCNLHLAKTPQYPHLAMREGRKFRQLTASDKNLELFVRIFSPSCIVVECWANLPGLPSHETKKFASEAALNAWLTQLPRGPHGI